MRAVNLLPVDQRGGRRRPPAGTLAVAGVAVLAASLLAMSFMSASAKVDERQLDLAEVEQQLVAEKRAAKPVEPPEPGLSPDRQQRFTVLSGALSTRLAWDRVLRDISLVLPEDVWLSTLSAAAESSESTEAMGLSVSFDGFTYSQESVARLLNRLTLVPTLAGVKLEKSTATPVGRQQIVNFTILANVTSGGETP